MEAMMKKVIHIAIMIMLIGLLVNCGAVNNQTNLTGDDMGNTDNSRNNGDILEIIDISKISIQVSEVDGEIGTSGVIANIEKYTFQVLDIEDGVSEGKAIFAIEESDGEIGTSGKPASIFAKADGEIGTSGIYYKVKIFGMDSAAPENSSLLVIFDTNEVTVQVNENGSFSFEMEFSAIPVTIGLALVD